MAEKPLKHRLWCCLGSRKQLEKVRKLRKVYWGSRHGVLSMIFVIICGGHEGGWFRDNCVLYVSRMAEADRRFMMAAGDNRMVQA